MKVTNISLRMDRFPDGQPALVFLFDLDGEPKMIASSWGTPTGIFQWGTPHEPDGVEALAASLHCTSRALGRLAGTVDPLPEEKAS